LASRVSVMKALLTTGMLALSVGPAVAVCVSHSPYDPRCSVQDMLDPSAASPQFYIQNPIARITMIRSCTAPAYGEARPPLSWCAAALSAQRFVNGGRYGSGGYP
jgi:hypothetical protein